jgi:hypothetical protein
MAAEESRLSIHGNLNFKVLLSGGIANRSLDGTLAQEDSCMLAPGPLPLCVFSSKCATGAEPRNT